MVDIRHYFRRQILGVTAREEFFLNAVSAPPGCFEAQNNINQMRWKQLDKVFDSQISPTDAQRSKDSMKILELNHVAIHVRDVAASCEFYSQVLRLEPLPRPAFTFPGAWFRLGPNQELHIIGERADPVISHHRGNHFALRLDDLPDWEVHFQKLGVKYSLPKSRPDGASQIFLGDPDGHRLRP